MGFSGFVRPNDGRKPVVGLFAVTLPHNARSVDVPLWFAYTKTIAREDAL